MHKTQSIERTTTGEAMPQKIDFNLIYALNLLLEEGSVSGAAEKMNLSAPAMSRILGRIRRSGPASIWCRRRARWS